MATTATRPAHTLERHYSIREAAALLGIPRSTLRTWVLQGLLPRIKIPSPGGRGRVLLKETDVVAFLARCREPATSEIVNHLRRCLP